jgi:flagella basal body P-ring formation protein FlgA
MRTLRTIILLAVALAGTAAADLIEKDVSRLKLRAQARVHGAAVTLADVLDFTQADPRLPAEIGEQPVVDGLAAPAVTEITHDQIVERLEELGVNLARVLVSGSLACRVALEPAPGNVPARTAERPAPLVRRGARRAGADTLANLLQTRIEQELAAANGTVEVEFERAGQEFLELTTPPFEFSIRGDRGQRLGLREFSVTLRRDGRTQRTVRIAARVKLVKQVLIAAKPLNVGAYIKHDSLDYATRIFSAGTELGIDHAEQVIGQRVKNFVPVGQMVRASDLRSVDLVKRSQPVTVIGSVSGNDSVSMRITGDALDSGGYGDTVRVRLGDSRENYREVRGVVSGVGVVRLMDGGL